MHHRLDVYGSEVFAVSHPKAWRRLRKRLPWISKTPGALALTEFSVRADKGGQPRGHLVLWVDVRRHGCLAELVDTCAHEATHGSLRILEHAGVPVSGDSSEAHAYLTGWLTGWLLESVAAGL